MKVLREDPKSVYYEKEKCTDKLNFFNLNGFRAPSWFDRRTAVQVLKVRMDGDQQIQKSYTYHFIVGRNLEVADLNDAGSLHKGELNLANGAFVDFKYC